MAARSDLPARDAQIRYEPQRRIASRDVRRVVRECSRVEQMNPYRLPQWVALDTKNFGEVEALIGRPAFTCEHAWWTRQTPPWRPSACPQVPRTRTHTTLPRDQEEFLRSKCVALVNFIHARRVLFYEWAEMLQWRRVEYDPRAGVLGGYTRHAAHGASGG